MRCSGIRTVSEHFMNHHAFQPQLSHRRRDRSVRAQCNTEKGMGRGAALMLALFAMMVVGTTTLSYVASRETSSSIAANAQLAADARTLASSGMSIAKGILRSSETIWRRNHVAGVLLNNYALDGGTVTVRLVDIVKRANPANGGNIFPDDSTTEVEVNVSSTRGALRGTQ